MLSLILCVAMLGTVLAACGGSSSAPASSAPASSAPASSAPSSSAPASSAPASNPEADKFPERTIEVVSQFGAGGGTDIYIRSIAVDAGKLLGQPVVHISAKGGGGVVAWDRFSTQPADGYTVYAIGPEQILMHAWGQLDLGQIIPVINSQLDTGFLYSLKGSQFTDIDSVVEYAKANPGKLNVAYTNPASFDEVLLGMWCKAAGIEITYVPYGSGSDAIAALMGGHVDILYEEVGPARASIDSGDFIPLVAFTDEPITGYDIVKDVPTSVSKGWDVTIGRWRGLAVKEGTDPAIIEKLYNAFAESMTMDTYKQVEKDNMLDIRPGLMNGEEFSAFIQSEIEKYTAIINELGIKPAA